MFKTYGARQEIIVLSYQSKQKQTITSLAMLGNPVKSFKKQCPVMTTSVDTKHFHKR